MSEAEFDPVRFVCGTRRVVRRSAGDYRVVCATCEGGGSQRFKSLDLAAYAAVRTSATSCQKCGAK